MDCYCCIFNNYFLASFLLTSTFLLVLTAFLLQYMSKGGSQPSCILELSTELRKRKKPGNSVPPTGILI